MDGVLPLSTFPLASDGDDEVGRGGTFVLSSRGGMADTSGLSPDAERRVGSSPTGSTKLEHLMDTSYTQRVTRRLENMHRMKNMLPASQIMDHQLTRQPVVKSIREAGIHSVLSSGYTENCTQDKGGVIFGWLIRKITGSHDFVKVYDLSGVRVMGIYWCFVCGQVERRV